MAAKLWTAAALVAALAVCGCGAKTSGPPGGKSAPSKELDTISHMGANPVPAVDPVGAFQVLKGAKHQIGCEHNLQQIGLSIQMYAAKKGEYPAPGAFFRTMVESGDITDINICAVPRSNPTRDEVTGAVGSEKVYRCTNDKLNDSTPGDKPIVWDPVAFEDGRHYLAFDGSVHFKTEDQWQAMFAKWEGQK